MRIEPFEPIYFYTPANCIINDSKINECSIRYRRGMKKNIEIYRYLLPIRYRILL